MTELNGIDELTDEHRTFAAIIMAITDDAEHLSLSERGSTLAAMLVLCAQQDDLTEAELLDVVRGAWQARAVN